jgi:flagellar hook-basal body complex protein FliE
MSIEAIGFLPPVGAAAPVQPEAMASALAPAQSPTAGFGDWFVRGMDEVNTQLTGSQSELQGLALGEAQNLHQVMIRLEESKLAFQLMVQVRNRLLESYQEVMRMQV